MCGNNVVSNFYIYDILQNYSTWLYQYVHISFHCLTTQHHVPGNCLHFLHWIWGVKTGHHRIDSAHRQMPLAICKIKLPAVLQISWVLTLETAQQPWRHGRLTSAKRLVSHWSTIQQWKISDSDSWIFNIWIQELEFHVLQSLAKLSASLALVH